MAFPLKLIFLTTLAIEVFSRNGITIRELPADMIGELLAMLSGSLTMKGQCAPPQELDVSFLLYTRSNPHNSTVLDPDNPTQVDPSKKIVLLVHGYVSGPTGYGFPQLIAAYLGRYDCNVILLDWSKIARQLYTTSYCEIPRIAQLAADFLCTLTRIFNLPLSAIHIVGHSLGAHLSGYIGKFTVPTCGQTVGRITGLDPAGPLYQDAPAYKRLNASDAMFVDVIHTNAPQFGYWGNIGSVDFQVNCGGVLQPGCPVVNTANTLDTLVSVVACSHLRALDLMSESLNTTQFIAKSCKSCPTLCQADLSNATFTIMGENCAPNPTNTKYWIPTKVSSPYAEGCTPYPIGCS